MKTKFIRLTTHNSMVGEDITTCFEWSSGWRVRVIDLKDQISGKCVEDSSVDEGQGHERVCAISLRKKP